jgi:hypothetical protein
MEPKGFSAITSVRLPSVTGQSEADMHWRAETVRADAMRGTGDDEVLYATGWTISGLATLGTILAVWVFGI